AAGTYSYVIKEQIPANTNGITYDTAEYVWTVVVKDNGTGKLVVDSETLTKDGKTATSADFTNTYSTTAISESVSGKKNLAGDRPEALKNGEFTFELWNADETTKITGVTNAADGTFTISQNYTAAGTYSYVIKEQIPANTNGITYDTAEYVWTVVVKDNGTGKLVVDSETLTKDGKTATSADFTNTYSATAISESVSGVKTLAGSRPEALKENEFTFELWNADKTTKITETKNAASGAFSFTQEYTAAGTYSYVIKEQIPSETNGIDYDKAEYVWTVVVKDDGKGALFVENETLTKGGETATSADFTNTYSAQPVKATVDGLKNLDGAPTSKEFTFELWAADKDQNITGTQAIDTFTNGADGKFVIETEEFTAPGTHYFMVKEQIPEGAVNNVYNGVTYDTTEYFWTVTITDNGSGALEASKTVNQDGSDAVFTFNNTTATGTVNISKQKVGGGNDIDGAVLSIEPVGDITFGSGITVSAAVKTVTESKITWTSEKEEVSITGLPVGTYTLTETVAPDGYALSEETIYFKIADDGKIYSVTEAEYKTDGTTEWKEVTDSTVIMEDAPYTSVFSKVDADLGTELPGATVTITPTAFADLSNVILPDDVEIVEGAITWTSTTEPKTIGALPDGVYEFKEVQAPYGYAIAEVVYVKIDGDNVYSATKAEYDAEGFDWSEVTAAEGDRVIMEDAVNKAVFSKRAADGGNELVGAILKITALDEGVTLDRVPEVSGVSLIESGKTLTWISDGTEKTIGQLPNGVYEFTEIAAPSGYAPAETIYVKIDNGNVYSATKAEYNNGKIDWSKVTAAEGDRVIMVDALNTATFSKTDTDAGDELPGAIINIVPVVSGTDLSEVAKNAPDHVTVEDGIISWESGTEPTVLKKLPDGEYKFIEITAPSGYEVAETIYFKVENGAVSSVPAADYDGEDTEWVAANGNKVIMKDAPNTLVLSKQATGAGEELPGAELSLTPVTSGTDISGVEVPTGVDNKDNKITWISKKDAPLTLNMIPDGVYKFTEDKAPLGYELAETIYIKVENGDIFSVAEQNYAGEDTLWGRAAELDTVLMLDDPTPEPKTVNFSFIKYSNIGTTVSGATFTLTGPNDFSASSTSNGTGGVAFTGLGEGVYTLLESACPPSYVKSEQIVYISVDAEGVISYKDATGKDIVHSDIETLMTNKIKPIEDEKKGNVGDVYNLYEQLLKEYKEYEDITITWESSDSSIIEVDQNGKATIKKVGKATITAKNGDTVLGTFVLGAEAVNGTEDETPNTGDTDAPKTGDVTTGWTIAVISLFAISAVVAKVSYDKIKRNAKNKAVR
ncbi:MAG: hypothetical protein E7546_04220, partial [Ruminococcaceae bacterium]|nr:hypothetical protein [Oscillospiraceae bacterium]